MLKACMSLPFYGQTVDSGSTNISNKRIRSFCTRDFILVARFIRKCQASHEILAHVFATALGLADFCRGDIHDRRIEKLDVIDLTVGIFQAEPFRSGKRLVQDVESGEVLAFVHECCPQCLDVEAFTRIYSHTVFGQDTGEVTPFVYGREVVRAYDQCEVVLRLTALERIQCADRVVRRLHFQFNVIHPHVQFRMSADSLDSGIVPVLSGTCINRVLKRIFGRYHQIDPIEFLLYGKVFHYGLMSDMERIERTGVNGNAHDQKLL